MRPSSSRHSQKQVLQSNNEFIDLMSYSHKALGRAFPKDSFRPVFLFGCAWRCGSTLLQRLISSSGEVFIWGENHALIAHLDKIHVNVSKWSSLIENQSVNFKKRKLKAWIANLNPNFPEGLTTASSAYLLYYYHFDTLSLGYKRWGFKEVRLDSSHANFLLTCFPNARIVFLIRDLKDVLASNAANDWYPSIGSAEGVAKVWMHNVSSFLNVDDYRILTIKYEDLVADTKSLCKLIEAHLSLKSSLDINIMNHYVRAADREPCLSNHERQMLLDPTVTSLLRRLGYLSEHGEDAIIMPDTIENHA